MPLRHLTRKRMMRRWADYAGVQRWGALQNAIGRVEAAWAPASSEEGFEIVRRRLFEPLLTKEQFVARDLVAREFGDMFVPNNRNSRLSAATQTTRSALRPPTPSIRNLRAAFYGWSTLIRFQRTRGVLRLMAAVIHSLWMNNDKNPLILPATIPIDDSRVRDELTRYLPDTWKPIIERDVDGPNALRCALMLKRQTSESMPHAGVLLEPFISVLLRRLMHLIEASKIGVYASEA